MSNQGFGSGLFAQLKQVKVTREGGIQAPVKANGTDGIVIGNPPVVDLGTAPEPDGVRRHGLLARLLRRLRRG